MSIENFVAHNPVRLHFGRNVTDKLGETVAQYGRRVLLLYGKGSVKRFGYYNLVKENLNRLDIETVEYSGIKPNPVVEDVEKAAETGRRHRVDAIVALGGGSVIDSAKVTALAIANNEDPWNFMTWQTKPLKSLPLICVLTLAATGTEMNAAAVIQNETTGQKLGYVNPLMFPKESFLDPSFTFTVPANYTAYGIVDLIAHALEAFFGAGEPPVIDKITASIITDAMDRAPRLLDNLTDYDLRANIMLDATLALNGLTSYGKRSGDWGVHSVGHELSLFYDTPHGATLSIVYPAWLKLQTDRIPHRISQLGKLIFGNGNIGKTIDLLEDFFRSIGAPVRLSEAGISGTEAEKIVAQLNKNKASGMHHHLNNEDHKRLVDFMSQG